MNLLKDRLCSRVVDLIYDFKSNLDLLQTLKHVHLPCPLTTYLNVQIFQKMIHIIYKAKQQDSRCLSMNGSVLMLLMQPKVVFASCWFINFCFTFLCVQTQDTRIRSIIAKPSSN